MIDTKQFIETTLKQAGKLIVSGFQKAQVIKVKGDQSNIVQKRIYLASNISYKLSIDNFPGILSSLKNQDLLKKIQSTFG